MKYLTTLFKSTALLSTFAASMAFGEEEIEIRTPSGQRFVLEIEPEDSFASVMQKIRSEVSIIEIENGATTAANDSKSTEYALDFMASTDGVQKQRDFSEKMSKSDKEDIRYILTTLATYSLTKLWGAESSLKRAGDRVDHVHPLNFLSFCFSDDELKGSFHCIRHRGGKIWKEFFSGLRDSLDEESKRDNLTEEFVNDFANKLDMKPSKILPSIQKRNWEHFFEILLKEIPRGGEPDRYDM
jgi:hypothetical protein